MYYMYALVLLKWHYITVLAIVFKNFTEFAGIIYRNCYCEERNVHWHILSL